MTCSRTLGPGAGHSAWRRTAVATAAVGGALALAAPAIATAAATTRIGSTSLPSGATMPASACTTSQTTEVLPARTASPFDYAVPAGGGSLTSWSFNSRGATPGTPYTLLVVSPSGSGDTIVATDRETVPASGSIATFPLAAPITVAGGDLIGAVVSPTSRVGCEFKGGSIPSSDAIGFGFGPATPGTSVSFAKTVADELVNVSATVAQSDDLAVSETAEPASVTLGDDVTFAISATSAGPSNTPVTVTDTLAAGLRFVSASAGTGSCTISGQTVTCREPSAPATLSIVARPSATGSYANTVKVTGPLLDPRPADNTATAHVHVSN